MQMAENAGLHRWLGRESGAALGPARLQHRTAARRRHPGAESMLLRTTASIGLKRALHKILRGSNLRTTSVARGTSPPRLAGVRFGSEEQRRFDAPGLDDNKITPKSPRNNKATTTNGQRHGDAHHCRRSAQRNPGRHLRPEARSSTGCYRAALRPPRGFRLVFPLAERATIPLSDRSVISTHRFPHLWINVWIVEGTSVSGNEHGTEWADVAARLRARVSEATWNAYFISARAIVFDDHRLVLGVPHSIAKERIESRFLDVLREITQDLTGQALAIVIDVMDHEAQPGSGFPEISPPVAAPPVAQPLHGFQVPSEKTPPPRASAGDVVLNARYTFEDFVIGASNRFAHAAAMSVAETPARSYNPLFIYGDSGLGKTHLLQGIAHYVCQNYPNNSRVRYVSTETFVTEFVDAIRTNTSAAFKRRYRDDCDVLLIDDIQFMEGKEGTQEEFFHTFNFLHQSGRQIVISSDRPPKSIATLEDRLRSRFEWGLITDITPPDLETRLAILRKKAERDRQHVPDDVLNFIATHIKDNIRELEGALNRVSAYAGLNRVTLDLAMAERVLSDLLSGSEPRPVTARAILDATAKMFGFSNEDLIGQSRRRPLVTARQIGMYVFRELTAYSYPMIGREFGDRDHTTVIHAVEKITEQMKERRAIYDQVTELIKIIKSGN